MNLLKCYLFFTKVEKMIKKQRIFIKLKRAYNVNEGIAFSVLANRYNYIEQFGNPGLREISEKIYEDCAEKAQGLRE